MRLPATGICLLIALAIQAATPFDTILARLLDANPSLRIEKIRAESSQEGLLAENQLAGPEAEFSRVWGSNAEVGNKWALSVSQSFDWPGVYAARREAARKAQSASQFLLESSLLEARSEARLLLIDAIHMSQLLEMQNALAQRVDSLERYFRKSAEEGTETRLDYNKTVIERIAVHRELHTLQAQWEELLSQISAFGGGLDAAALVSELGSEYPPVPAQLTLPGVETLRSRDPAYAAALAAGEAARSLVKVENRLRMPGFSIGYVHETELGGNFDGFSIGVTLPSWGKNRKALAAKLEAEASLIEAEMAVTRTHARMTGELARVGMLRHIIDEYQPVVADDAPFTLLRKALHAGQITYLTYIEESNYLIAARRDYLDTLWEYHTLIASLCRYE